VQPRKQQARSTSQEGCQGGAESANEKAAKKESTAKESAVETKSKEGGRPDGEKSESNVVREVFSLLVI